MRAHLVPVSLLSTTRAGAHEHPRQSQAEAERGAGNCQGHALFCVSRRGALALLQHLLQSSLLIQDPGEGALSVLTSP